MLLLKVIAKTARPQVAALKADIRLIVGLGNPGADYTDTRHNAGFWFMDSLAQQLSVSFRFDKRFNAAEAKIQVQSLTNSKDIILLKPQTFMNRSGQSVGAVARYYKLLPAQILVVHDELDLAPGDNRLKQGGGHGGHNGLRDIINHLVVKDFFRLRVGIGHPGDRNQVINYVLHKPSISDQNAIEEANQRSLDVMPQVLEGRLDKAMQALHT
ncbi:MAG: PTH1 family peptidyl-tRNA hydrolase [Gammaproteobacteria bacterium]|jgi:PTH1 family peptidyl-tRNA hydrolase